MGQRRKALFAAFQYLVLGTIGATFYVIGIGFLYLMTGHAQSGRSRRTHGCRSGPAPGNRRAGLHYRGNRDEARAVPVASMVAQRLRVRALGGHGIPGGHGDQGVAVCADTLLLRRIRQCGDIRTLRTADVLLALSVAGIVAMSLVAVFQSDLKRMFAYSSVAQIGYIMLGIALTNDAGLTGGIAHLFNHGVTKGALFLLAGGIALRSGSTASPR